MRVIVTGGAGFIGSAMVWQLNRLGVEDVIVTDLLGTDAKWKNLVPLRFSDIITPETLLKDPAAFDADAQGDVLQALGLDDALDFLGRGFG